MLVTFNCGISGKFDLMPTFGVKLSPHLLCQLSNLYSEQTIIIKDFASTFLKNVFFTLTIYLQTAYHFTKIGLLLNLSDHNSS